MAKEEQKAGFIFRLRGYFIVLLSYAAALLIFLIILDNFIMPSIVHKNQKVKTPNIVGIDAKEAEKILKQASLNIRISRQTYNEKFPEGYVITQTPNAHREVKTGRPIFVTVSKGKETVAVPYLIGSNLRAARISLMQRGLELGEIEYELSEIYLKDTIISQSKNAGSFVPYGSRIDLVISKGSETQSGIPMLIGYSFEEIHSVLAQSGFILGNVTYRESGTYLPNTVIDQMPKPDQMGAEGTAIHIVVSK